MLYSQVISVHKSAFNVNSVPLIELRLIARNFVQNASCYYANSSVLVTCGGTTLSVTITVRGVPGGW